jgi:phospholipase/carboxylesterase
VTQSILVRRRVQSEAMPRRGRIIALHGGAGRLDDLVPLARSISPFFEVIAVEAPRRVHYAELTAYTWYYAQEPNHPEPVTFGDGLFQLEQLVYEISETDQDKREPLYLLGFDQGAVLALAIAMVVPDYLDGVIAICGCLPEITGWPLPDRALDSLPVQLVYDPEDVELPAALVELAETELTKRGGAPVLSAVSGARNLVPTGFEAVRNWMRTRTKA